MGIFIWQFHCTSQAKLFKGFYSNAEKVFSFLSVRCKSTIECVVCIFTSDARMRISLCQFLISTDFLPLRYFFFFFFYSFKCKMATRFVQFWCGPMCVSMGFRVYRCELFETDVRWMTDGCERDGFECRRLARCLICVWYETVVAFIFVREDWNI